MRPSFLTVLVTVLVAVAAFGTRPVAAQPDLPPLQGWEVGAERPEYDRFLAPIALAPPESPPEPSDEGELPFYLGERFRAPNMCVWARFWVSLAGTTVHFLEWDRYDWMWFGLTVGGTLAFMAPTDPSPDARLQFWIQERRSKVMDKVFWRLTSERFSAIGLGFIGVVALSGWIGDSPDLVEWASLMFETLGIVQLHHTAQKLTIGRESPYQGDGLGIVHGPTMGYKLYPSGTPSGHTASVFALVTLTMDYFDKVWLDVIGYTFYAYIGASVLYNNQHFISDVIWGAPLGYFIGKWMVRHRSSKYRYRKGKVERLDDGPARFIGFAPFSDPLTGASGLTATFSF